MSELRIGLRYDDVLLGPRLSRVRSRQDASTRSSLIAELWEKTRFVRQTEACECESHPGCA